MTIGPTAAPFIGRKAELSRLRALVAGGSEPGPVIRALIVGEPGIGKTRLVSELITSKTKSTGARCSMARVELSTRPGASPPIVEASRTATIGVHAELASLLAPPAHQAWQADLPVLPPALRFQEIDRVAAVIASDSIRQPVLLVIEDLQWADAATIGVLHRLATAVAQARILMVCTMRPHPTDSAVAQLASSRRR